MQIAFEVSIDAQPLHIASHLHLLAPDDGNVVLRIAAHDARIATDAAVQIDRHSPRILNLPRRRIRLRVTPLGRKERGVLINLLSLWRIPNFIDQRPACATLMRKVRILLDLIDCRVADDRPLLSLMAGEGINPVGVEQLLLEILLREAAAMLDIVHLGNAQVVRSRHLLRSDTRNRKRCI